MLDEPLGSLDRPRREELTEELRHLLRGIGVTVLHVTHDHDEAFAVADRVAVMQSGRIARIGTPAEIWRDPRKAAVARFLGHANVVTVGEGGAVPWGRLSVPPGPVVLRSDAFSRTDGSAPDDDDCVTGTVADARFRGDSFELTLHTDPGDFDLVVRDPHPAAAAERLSYADRSRPDRRPQRRRGLGAEAGTPVLCAIEPPQSANLLTEPGGSAGQGRQAGRGRDRRADNQAAAAAATSIRAAIPE